MTRKRGHGGTNSRSCKAWDDRLKRDVSGRRAFLVSASGFAVAVPFLESFFGSNKALGAAGRRFIAIHNGHGQFNDQWHPDPTKFTWTRHNAHTRSVELANIQGNISPILTGDFDSLRSKLSLISRLSYTSEEPNHNAEAYLSSGALGSQGAETSIDHIIASAHGGRALNLAVPFPSLETDKSQCSVRAGTKIVGQLNPSAVFKTLFPDGQAVQPAPGAMSDQVVMAGPRLSGDARRKMIDVTRAEFTSLLSSGKLSALDAQKLKDHFDALADLQRQIPAGGAAAAASGSAAPTGTTASQCGQIVGPSSSPYLTGKDTDYQVLLEQHLQVLALAVKCNGVSSATLQLHPYDWTNSNLNFLGLTGLFHEDVGHGHSRSEKLALMRFYSKRVADFMKSLDVPEVGGQTYLDNGVVLWFGDMAVSNSPGDHGKRNLQTLIAGSAAGSLNTGRYIDFGPDIGNNYPSAYDDSSWGRPINQLLMTLLAACGVDMSAALSSRNGFGYYGSTTDRFAANGAGDHKGSLLPLLWKQA